MLRRMLGGSVVVANSVPVAIGSLPGLQADSLRCKFVCASAASGGCSGALTRCSLLKPELRSWGRLVSSSSSARRSVPMCCTDVSQEPLAAENLEDDGRGGHGSSAAAGQRQAYEGVSTSAVLDDVNSHSWTALGRLQPVNSRKRIFCNRSLNMKSIVAVGFDMDYTLAQYKPDTFETLAYNGTIKKLVYDLGYPEELLRWEFDWTYMVRGLVLDKRRGNIIKMDRHKYVKVAYHGFRELSREERHATYGNTLSRESFDEPDYALIDTLFSLAEAYLFAQIVELTDASPNKIPCSKEVLCIDGVVGGFNYAQIYRDVRAAVDLCHRDGTLKLAVASNPGEYIHEDPHLVPMLKMLRSSGRMTFLVTNSLWDYTHVVMNYVFGKSGGDGGTPRDDAWLNFFDVVITGSAKPNFFVDGNRSPLFEVDISTGMLRNTDNGTPLIQVGGLSSSPQLKPENTIRQGCRVFQGGSVAHLHRLLGIEAGEKVLYVGDHIYGDILRSKKQLGWRTMLVVPELEHELELLQQTTANRKEIWQLRQERDELEDTLHRLEWALRSEKLPNEEQEQIVCQIAELQQRRDKVREDHREAQRACHQVFHKTWGQLLKTGYQNSRFAHQVERFACLYSSNVTNLCYYSVEKRYRTSEDSMPHDLMSMDSFNSEDITQ